ncbi:hypothetical protein J7W19_09170 [Streptomyces mobaraensis NBRC 13819 = DSM 40847]|uniref:hypothetical protein n=1 Tax=Streptomyces mobaraensis TaxID=35621 RepID=UPI001319E996|nr:hypothetical protein [Streptomyces mobaraensis]QTT73576.1 hypothetical protein J7W19_09170 [Streptomyces mobaraensis NBRC 13819 = DSM 40847]
MRRKTEARDRSSPDRQTTTPAGHAAQAAVAEVSAVVARGFDATDHMVNLELTTMPLTGGFPPRRPLEQLAATSLPGTHIRAVTPVKPPWRWIELLHGSLETTAPHPRTDRHSSLAETSALRVAQAIERHLGAVRIAARIGLVHEASSPAWQHAYALVTATHLAGLLVTVED